MKYYFMILLFFGQCAFGQAQQLHYKTLNDLPYYPTDAYQNDPYKSEKAKLDLYYPTDKKEFATIIWFHGGGLTGGGKEIPEDLKTKGYAVVGVGYRLSPKVKAPAYIEDAAAAIAWVFQHIADYGGDPSAIFLSGHSAGGYLDLMVGLDKKWLAPYHIDPNRIAGLIPLSPQCITHYTIRQEKGIPDKQAVIDELAPIYHARGDAPPLLLITGNREMELLGRYEENAYLARMMKLNGHTQTKLYELDGYGHNMLYPGCPLLLEEVKRILQSKEK